MALYRMVSRFALVALPAAVVSAGLIAPVSAAGTSGRDCHAAFQAAKTSGTLQGQGYLAFKAANCGASGSASATASTTAPAAPTVAAPSAPASVATPATPSVTKPSAPSAPAASSSWSSKPTGLPAATAQASGKVVFPSAIAPQFAKLSAGKARMKTCAAQYQANKANGGNGGLSWIVKGGGYWSQCNAHLKN